MRFDLKLFKSRLAWRFFGLFVACALVPILGLALLTYTLVAGHLKERAFEDLRNYARNHAMSIFEMLNIAEQQLIFLGDAQFARFESGDSVLFSFADDRSGTIFQSIGTKMHGSWQHLEGSDHPFDELDRALEVMPLPGKTVLTMLTDGHSQPELAMVHNFDGQENSGFLAGIIRRDYLWESERGSILPAGMLWSVWDHQENIIYSTLFPEAREGLDPGKIFSGAHWDTAVLSLQGNKYYSAYWSLFTRPQFHFPYLSIHVLQPEKDALAPFYLFQTFFPGVIIVSLAIVVYLSSIAIRRSLTPIDSLMEGARQVSRGCFSHRVVSGTRDEFQQLAEAFNHMSTRLDSQFRLLSARSELDREILSHLEIERIIEKTLPRLSLFFPCTAGVIAYVDKKRSGQVRIYQQMVKGHDLLTDSQLIAGSGQDRIYFDGSERVISFGGSSSPPSFLKNVRHWDAMSWLLIPVPQNNQPPALICFGFSPQVRYADSDLEQARQLAEQVAVAFSKADLFSELKELNLGASNALARTVDAKSPWTAGHSERVTVICMELGRKMGIQGEELNNFRHAALLHDIGKIAVPSSILDKKEPLSPEEFNRIREHPSIGARILQPIQAYQGLIPIVEQHHERYDGKGYPGGLGAGMIHPLARIMAVADSYDAMVSDRPYRKGMTHDLALSIILKESGRQFDPDVVSAFIELVKERLAASAGKISPENGFPAVSENTGLKHKPRVLQPAAQS